MGDHDVLRLLRYNSRFSLGMSGILYVDRLVVQSVVQK
jgi:hypothetical protein